MTGKKKKESKITDLYSTTLSNGMFFEVWKDEDQVFITLDFMCFNIPKELFCEFVHLLYACHIKASDKPTKEGLEEAEDILRSHDEFIEEIKKDEEEKGSEDKGLGTGSEIIN